jgi:hypothetical protein
MSTVYIVNRSYHDFDAAAPFGELKYLSSGTMSRYGTNFMARQFEDVMKDSSPTDYIVPCSLNVMNMIAAAIFVHKHGRLNLLLYKKGTYIERNLVFS